MNDFLGTWSAPAGAAYNEMHGNAMDRLDRELAKKSNAAESKQKPERNHPNGVFDIYSIDGITGNVEWSNPIIKDALLPEIAECVFADGRMKNAQDACVSMLKIGKNPYRIVQFSHPGLLGSKAVKIICKMHRRKLTAMQHNHANWLMAKLNGEEW